jgi:heme/copper-type cytochrome/quinol oxidase subunit 2
MTVVSIDTSTIDAMIMQWVYIAIGLVIVLIAVLFFVVWDRHRTPKPCGLMKKAHLLKVPLILLAGLAWFLFYFPVRLF